MYLHLNIQVILLLLDIVVVPKTNLVFNILTLNPVYDKIYIFTKEPEDKYNFLLKKFPHDVKIFYQNKEYNLDDLIKGNYQSCCIFEDLITDDKK